MEPGKQQVQCQAGPKYNMVVSKNIIQLLLKKNSYFFILANIF